MKYKILHIALIISIAVAMTGCYGYRQVGLLQEREDLPQYDSVAYEPYRLQVNDEVIYRVITMDETIAKTMSANTSAGGQYANSYRIYSDGTVDIPTLCVRLFPMPTSSWLCTTSSSPFWVMLILEPILFIKSVLLYFKHWQ